MRAGTTRSAALGPVLLPQRADVEQTLLSAPRIAPLRPVALERADRSVCSTGVGETTRREGPRDPRTHERFVYRRSLPPQFAAHRRSRASAVRYLRNVPSLAIAAMRAKSGATAHRLRTSEPLLPARGGDHARSRSHRDDTASCIHVRCLFARRGDERHQRCFGAKDQSTPEARRSRLAHRVVRSRRSPLRRTAERVRVRVAESSAGSFGVYG